MINQKKISWEYIKEVSDKCIRDNHDMSAGVVDYRSSEIQDRYDKWKLNVGENNLYDILFKNNEDVVIRRNDFPYFFEEGIDHYVVWLRPDQNIYKYNTLIDSSLKLYIDDFIKEKYSSDLVKWIYFRNEPINRSINSIPHYHLIINY